MSTVTLEFASSNEDDMKGGLYTLAVQLRGAIHGEELAKTPAVDTLGYLLSVEDEWRRDCGFPVMKSVKPSQEDLLIFWEAMKAGNSKFFSNLSEAIEQRKKPAHIDNVRAIVYIMKQYFAWRRSERGPVTLQELKAHGVKNPGRVRTFLRLEFIKDDEAKRGKKREKNTQ